MAELSILLVEDDPSTSKVVTAALESRGYHVIAVTTGRGALDAATAEYPDIVVLDLGLPDLDGIEVCRHLRVWLTNPIVVLSADGAEDRKIDALDAGADDYVTKPFSVAELLARLRVAERHREVLARTVDDAILRIGDLTVDTGGREATINGQRLTLSRREFDLLELLARNAGRVLTHGVLLSQVWGRSDGGTGSLRSHVTRLRNRLGTGPDRPSLVSDPGTGYRLLLPASLDPKAANSSSAVQG